MESIKLKSLGRSADFGSFYDARTDSFIHGIKLFNQTIPESLIKTTDSTQTSYSYNFEDTMSSKFEKLEINAELKLSILAGLISLEGSGKYLNEEKKSFKSVKATIIYNSRTKDQSINLAENGLKAIVSGECLQNSNIGTHVVVGIDWGANVFFTFEHQNSENIDKSVIAGSLKAEMEKFKYCSFSGQANLEVNNNSESISN